MCKRRIREQLPPGLLTELPPELPSACSSVFCSTAISASKIFSTGISSFTALVDSTSPSRSLFLCRSSWTAAGERGQLSLFCSCVCGFPPRIIWPRINNKAFIITIAWLSKDRQRKTIDVLILFFYSVIHVFIHINPNTLQKRFVLWTWRSATLGRVCRVRQQYRLTQQVIFSWCFETDRCIQQNQSSTPIKWIYIHVGYRWSWAAWVHQLWLCLTAWRRMIEWKR